MKKIISALFTVLLITSLLISNVSAAVIDVSKESSLKVTYHVDDIYFSDVEVKIYRIAQVSRTGIFTLAGDFVEYPVDVTMVETQAEWDDITTTLESYITADKITPYATVSTDENGEASFPKIETGLYLVLGTIVDMETAIYTFKTFLAAVPSPDAEGNPIYEVEAIPKHDVFIPEPDEIEYKVVKQWKDEGNGESRPNEVEIEIYKDGELQSKQILNAETNWSYRWVTIDDGSKWQVVERNVPEGYSVTVNENQTTFTVVNTYVAPPSPPQTGDTSVMWPYVLLMFISGGVLLVIAMNGRKVKA